MLSNRTPRTMRPLAAAALAAALLATALPLLTVLGASPAGAATFTVTTTADEVSANGQTSLREAISQSNGTVNVADTITLQAGATYVLDRCDALPFEEEELNVSGDLDHTDNNPTSGLTIVGNGATIEQTCPGERVLEMRFLQPLTIRDLTIRGGAADVLGGNNAHGGAIEGTGDWLIEDVTFTDNQADGIGSVLANGGDSAEVTLRRVRVVENGPGLHGAVRITAPDLTVEDSLIADNDGTGLYGLQGMTVDGTTISGNGDSGVAAAAGTVTITDSTLSGNGGPLADAGAGNVGDADLNVVNSTVVGNQSELAGGFFAAGDGTFDLDFVTFSGNGVRNLLNNAGTTSLTGVVLGQPTSSGSCGGGMAVTAVGSYEQGGNTCGLSGPTNVVDGADPVLGPLVGDPGVPATRIPGVGSPLVDLVPVGQCPLADDQLGLSRPVDGDFDGVAECDAGAVERRQGQPFTDVGPAHPFFTEIGWMAWNGISTGSQPGPAYRPSEPVSRQAMSAFLYRLAGEPTYSPPGTPTFSDVGAATPFFLEVEWMNSEGITTGFPGGVFKPVSAVTRQSMSAFMHRMAGEPAGPFPNPGFSDVTGSHPFFLQISWMAQSGVTEGYQDGTFKPGNPVTRQAMSAFMQRFAQQL